MDELNLPTKVKEALDALYAAGPGQAEMRRAQARLRHALSPGGRAPLWFDLIPQTPIGAVYVAANEQGVVSVDFGVSEGQFLSELEKRFGAIPARSPERLAPYTARIAQYLDGGSPQLNVPFDISTRTPFQQAVLRAALQIPRGQVLTYQQVAEKIGKPKAARAVGGALGANPVPLVIPCHRVVAANGKLGGYSGGGGVETKRRLLALEGAIPA
jgi:methylated-DNA-[protein]-cysteine S-methyltransferase